MGGSLTNQEIMSHIYIHFGTIVARGSRTCGSNMAFGSLRPFGPGSNVARGSRTRGSRTRGSRTRGSNVAFGSLMPFGPGSNVARGWRIRGSNVAFGSLRPFGPGLNVTCGSNVARGSSLGSLTNQEIMSHLYNTLWDNCRTRFEDTRLECGLRLPKALRAWFECRTRFECGEPNQPRDNVTPIHTLWDKCRTRFEDTRFECGLRLPKALRAWFECRTPC